MTELERRTHNTREAIRSLEYLISVVEDDAQRSAYKAQLEQANRQLQAAIAEATAMDN